MQLTDMEKGCGGKFLEAGRGDIGIVCNLMVGVVGVGEEGAGEWARSLKRGRDVERHLRDVDGR